MTFYPIKNLLAEIDAHKLTSEALMGRLEEEKVKVQHLEHMLTSKERDLLKQKEIANKSDLEIRMLKSTC